jgi:hypothetical protein
MGQVHTYAKKYVETQDGFVQFTKASKAVELKEQSIRALQAKEAEFYAWLNCSNFKDFIRKLRGLFSDADNDKRVLQNFKKANLDLLLGNDKSLSEKMLGQTVVLELENPKEGINLKELLGPNFDGPTNSIYFSWTPYAAKDVMNILEKEVFDRQKHRFQRGKTSMAAMRQEIKYLIEAGAIKDISIISDEKSKRQSIKESFSPKGSIFGYTEKEIQKAYEDKEQWELIKPELKQRKVKAFNFLMGLCSQGSDTIKKAFINAWNEKIGAIDDDSDDAILNFSFLSTGASRTHLKGNIQELLAAAILGEYVTLKTGQGINRKVAEVLGNVLNESKEPPKTDVRLFESIGIQVKAYDPEKEFMRNERGESVERLMGTNIHPNKLDTDLRSFLQQGGLNISSNIGDYMVQACFNKTNKWTDADFTEAMENALVQLMSMDTGVGLSDAICFYLVDVTQLVPASHVLASFQETEPIISYRAPDTFDGQDDSYYNKRYGDFIRSDGTEGPNFLLYYQGLDLEPTEKAFKTYKQLYTRDISIDVKFNYKFMYNAKYSII